MDLLYGDIYLEELAAGLVIPLMYFRPALWKIRAT
jgi:hypothetical protein